MKLDLPELYMYELNHRHWAISRPCSELADWGCEFFVCNPVLLYDINIWSTFIYNACRMVGLVLSPIFSIDRKGMGWWYELPVSNCRRVLCGQKRQIPFRKELKLKFLKGLRILKHKLLIKSFDGLNINRIWTIKRYTKGKTRTKISKKH